ncbi:hypothetical protein JCM10212_006623 [Sporobolomyces blumeae]
MPSQQDLNRRLYPLDTSTSALASTRSEPTSRSPSPQPLAYPRTLPDSPPRPRVSVPPAHTDYTSSSTSYTPTIESAHYSAAFPPTQLKARRETVDKGLEGIASSQSTTTTSRQYSLGAGPTGPTANPGGASPVMSAHASLARRHSPVPSPPHVSMSSSRPDGGYIGGAFVKPTQKRGSGVHSKDMLALLKGRKTRWTRVAALVVGVLIMWSITKGWSRPGEPRKKLDHRWWEVQDPSPEDVSALMPKPTLTPKPPRPKPPPPPHSHTLAQLLRLPSTLSASSSSFRANADWTAIVHLTSSSQLLASHLHPILRSLADQAPLAPSRILLLCPSGMEPQPSVLSPFHPLVATLPYSPGHPPLLTLAQAAQSDITTAFIVFVDAHLPSTSPSSSGAAVPLPKDYVKVLLHAFGTKEYSSSLLSSGGLYISTSSVSSPSSGLSITDMRCVHPAYSNAQKKTERISVPSTPFLLPTQWLLPRSHSSSPENEVDSISVRSPTVLQGLPLSSLPLEIAMSLALWTKSAIPAYAIPLPLAARTDSSDRTAKSDLSGVDGWNCEKFKRSLEREPTAATRSDGLLERVRQSFVERSGAGEGLKRIQGDRKKGGLRIGSAASGKRKMATSVTERAHLMRKGSFVLLVSGRDEVEAVSKVACRFSNGVDEDDGFDVANQEGGGGRGDAGHHREVRIVASDWDDERDGEWLRSLHATDSAHGAGSCHLEVTPLTTTATTPEASISLPLIDMLDTNLSPPPAFVLYLTDGPRAREFEEVLKWMGGIFSVKKGGERWSRVRAEKEAVGLTADGTDKGRMTVVGMSAEEARRAEWVGALPIEALRHWHTPRIDVSVITNDRPVSLHRLLSSLQSADYYGDDVSLALNLEQTTDRLTHRLVDDFRWPHGPLQIRHRILLGGLMPAIVESWYPTSNDTYGVLLEDDVEVSPLFYGWLKFTILKYRYTLAGRAASSRLFGVSLYQQKNIELRPEGRQPFDAHKLFESLSLHPTTPYLSQIPCSWGAAYFPEVWREFHSYLSLRLSELALPISEPIVPAIRSNRWPRSWKKYFIELVYLRGYSMLYPNYPGFESLSTNHLEKGTHIKTSRVEDKKKVLFEVPLLDQDGSLVDALPLGQLPEWDSLPVMDLWGALASNDELVERGWQTTRQIGSCETVPDISSLTGRYRLKYDARELLCTKQWDRETLGRLVRSQPLKGRTDAAVVVDGTTGSDVDQGRMEAAQAEAAAQAADRFQVDDPGARQVRRNEAEGDDVAGTDHLADSFQGGEPEPPGQVEPEQEQGKWYPVHDDA